MELNKKNFMKLWNLNPTMGGAHENQNNTYLILQSIVNSRDKESTFDGEHIIDFDFIYKRYEAYVHDWQRKWGNTDEKYIKAEYKIKSLYKYLDDKLYHSDVMKVSPESDDRFKIIFNNCSLEQVKESFDFFRSELYK